MTIKTVKCTSPSNIAFVKYWGKYGRQLPMNPSISMTLKNCHTVCEVTYQIDDKNPGLKSFQFENEENSAFSERIEKFLESISDIYPLVNSLSLEVKTSNSFPHSAGIASSASAMSALCFCLAQIESEVNGESDKILEKASFMSRLASGSACRSIYPDYASWGEYTSCSHSSNEYASLFTEFHESFKKVKDTILIVSSETKGVSSSLGHTLMNGHPFKDSRKEQALENMRVITNAMKLGDWDTFGEILENEALTLHALMMTSNPSFILLKPESLSIIDKIRSFRKKTKTPLYFTIDAGPNMHLIYPEAVHKDVMNFIESDLKEHCENGKYIEDEIGVGSVLL